MRGFPYNTCCLREFQCHQNSKGRSEKRKKLLNQSEKFWHLHHHHKHPHSLTVWRYDNEHPGYVILGNHEACMPVNTKAIRGDSRNRENLDKCQFSFPKGLLSGTEWGLFLQEVVGLQFQEAMTPWDKHMIEMFETILSISSLTCSSSCAWQETYILEVLWASDNNDIIFYSKQGKRDIFLLRLSGTPCSKSVTTRVELLWRLNIVKTKKGQESTIFSLWTNTLKPVLTMTSSFLHKAVSTCFSAWLGWETFMDSTYSLT